MSGDEVCGTRDDNAGDCDDGYGLIHGDDSLNYKRLNEKSERAQASENEAKAAFRGHMEASVHLGDSNPGWYGNMRGKIEASIARSKAVDSAIDSHALGGLKSRIVANSTARQTEV
jgi:hypothetical protein